MGGPNDQGTSSTWFHFELKILEHLTMASRARLASNGTLYSTLSTQIMLNLSDFVHLLHAFASVMKFCAQIVQPETLNPLKNPPNPTAETLTLEKSPNPAKTLTLTLRSKEKGGELTSRAAMAVTNGERSPGTWSRAASQTPHRPAPTHARASKPRWPAASRI